MKDGYRIWGYGPVLLALGWEKWTRGIQGNQKYTKRMGLSAIIATATTTTLLYQNRKMCN
jgi:hypothetical protein